MQFVATSFMRIKLASSGPLDFDKQMIDQILIIIWQSDDKILGL
jgi:hypothetical protein